MKQNFEEKWVAVAGFEGIYEVSNAGEVRSLDRISKHANPNGKKEVGAKKKLSLNKGYRRISLWRNGFEQKAFVHRLVAIAFLPNPEALKEVNHLDGDKSNNRVGNLEWCDRRRNNRHAIDNKLWVAPSGEKHHNSKLTDKDVEEIRWLLFLGGITKRRIAKYFGVSESTIGQIDSGRTRRKLT